MVFCVALVAIVLAGCGSTQHTKSKESGETATYDSSYAGWKPGKEKDLATHLSNPTSDATGSNAPEDIDPDPEDPFVEGPGNKQQSVEEPVVEKTANEDTKEPASIEECLEHYTISSQAAFAASKTYFVAEGSDKDEAYIVWAEHLYAALGYANGYASFGGEVSDLPKLFEIKQLKAGQFKNALGPSDDPRVKKAIKKWQESTS